MTNLFINGFQDGIWVSHQDQRFTLPSFWTQTVAHLKGTSPYWNTCFGISPKVRKSKLLNLVADPDSILQYYPGTHVFAFIQQVSFKTVFATLHRKYSAMFVPSNY